MSDAVKKTLFESIDENRTYSASDVQSLMKGLNVSPNAMTAKEFRQGLQELTNEGKILFFSDAKVKGAGKSIHIVPRHRVKRKHVDLVGRCGYEELRDQLDAEVAAREEEEEAAKEKQPVPA